MKRDLFIFLLQPYKNRLMPRAKLSGAINRFAENLLALCNRYPHLRFNIALPGYILECIDPLTLSSLRDVLKKGGLEWLCTGYTEPFLSFSPHWLTNENINLGLQTFTELTGESPSGYVPPFSNWEPSHIDLFRNAGLKYSVISNELLGASERTSCGYWITEHTGSSIAVFPARSYNKHNAPQSLQGWIENTFPTESPNQTPRLYVLRYLHSLQDEANEAEQYSWIEQISSELDKRILQFQPVKIKDALGSTTPLGLHYFPSSLVPSNNEPSSPYFLNHLHCHDQIGILQRKLMEACDNIRNLKDSKRVKSLNKQLFFVQDINRFLPSESAGFSNISDRLWTYGKLIDIERELHDLSGNKGGVIRLTDFLRNGYKSIIVANRSLKLYMDHKNGAQIYELDYRDRSFNACAAYNPRIRSRPNVISSGESRLSFAEKIFTDPISCNDYRTGVAKDAGNFSTSPFEYTFRKSTTGVKVALKCQGGFFKSDRNCPLGMEKVIGLEGDNAVLTFSYQLSNNSLTNYQFTLGIELALALPGCSENKARIVGDKKSIHPLGQSPVMIENISNWEIEDSLAGIKMQFVTQKQVNVWAIPPEPLQMQNTALQGIILMINCPVSIDESSSWSFVGKVGFRKLRVKDSDDDTI